MNKRYDSAIKEKALEAVKNGTPVSQVCQEQGLNSKTIYYWLRQQADNTGTSNLEIARLRKENQELKEIIGLFALEKKRAEKNTKSS